MTNATTTNGWPQRWLGMDSRFIRMAAGALTLAVLLIWGLWPKAIGVDTAKVTEGPMVVTVDEEGKTRIKDVFVVSAPQSGIMLRSPLLAGDPVTKGKSLVAMLQPAQPPFLDLRTRLEVIAQAKAAEAAVRLAEAEFGQARAEQKFAEAELARAKSLAASSNISDKAREKAEQDDAVARAAVAKADANVAVRKRQLESIQARLVDPEDEAFGGLAKGACCVEVRSPVTGRVLRILQTSEQVLSAGTPLLEVGDPRAIEIIVELLSTDAVKVREGASVAIEGWGGGETLSGTVRRTETAAFTKISALGIEEQRVRVVIDLDAASLARHTLGHEFRVFTRIRIWESPKAMRVPIGALFRQRGEWAVFRVSGGRVRLTALKLGHRNSEYAQVLGGLSAGDVVVVHPSDRVVDGVRVTARAEPVPQ